MKSIERNEIRNLIMAGFELEAISFEFDIPMGILQEYKNEIEKEPIKKTTSKMQELRERYNELYYSNSKPILDTRVEMTDEQRELIESVISTVEETISGMNGKEKNERRKSASTILTEMEKVKELQLTIEQAKKLQELLKSIDLNKMRIRGNDRIGSGLREEQSRSIIKLVDAIEIEQAQTTDIEQLKKLKTTLNEVSNGTKNILLDKLTTQITHKIHKLQTQNAISKIRNDISPDIEKIVRELASGRLNIENANQIIQQEAQRRVQNRPKNKFSISEESERNQIKIQIKKFLKEKSEVYEIENPETTIQQLCQLTGENEENAISIVIENYIERKEFEKAREICKRFNSRNRESDRLIFISKLRKRIGNAELGHLILKSIQKDTAIEDDERNFEAIENGLNRGNIKLGAISLGKNQDGTKNITLEDIWDKEKSR